MNLERDITHELIAKLQANTDKEVVEVNQPEHVSDDGTTISMFSRKCDLNTDPNDMIRIMVGVDSRLDPITFERTTVDHSTEIIDSIVGLISEEILDTTDAEVIYIYRSLMFTLPLDNKVQVIVRGNY